MGKVFLQYLDSPKGVYACKTCMRRGETVHLAAVDEVISHAFHSRNGPAYLFSSAVNVSFGPQELTALQRLRASAPSRKAQRIERTYDYLARHGPYIQVARRVLGSNRCLAPRVSSRVARERALSRSVERMARKCGWRGQIVVAMGDHSRSSDSPVGGHPRAPDSTALVRRVLGKHGLHGFFVPEHNTPQICSRCGAFRRLEHVAEAADPHGTLLCAACGGAWQRGANSSRDQRSIGPNALIRVSDPAVLSRRLLPRSTPGAGRDRSALLPAPGASLDLVERQMTTGMHLVQDTHCVSCGEVVGWYYVKAYEQRERYKETKHILERSCIEVEQPKRESSMLLGSSASSSGGSTSFDFYE